MKGELSSEFYIDPQQDSIKRGVFTFTFNYAVDKEQFKKALSLEYDKTESEISTSSSRPGFSVSFGENDRRAFVTTENLAAPKLGGKLKLKVAKGWGSSRSGEKVQESKDYTLDVPGLVGYFKVEDATFSTVRNDKYESERILVVRTNLAVASEEVAKALGLSLLPVKHPSHKKQKKYSWSSASEVTSEISKLLEPVKFEVVPAEQANSKLHSFRVNVPVDRFVMVELRRTLKAHGGYEMDNNFLTVLEATPLPAEVFIAAKGSLLSLSGDKKLSVVTRGVDDLEVVISRVLPDHLNVALRSLYDSPLENFVPYAEDKFAFVEEFKTTMHIGGKSQSRTDYVTLDMAKYLSSGGVQKRGIFFLELSAQSL
jgi:uncharacterized protein YfaS (alpha-2-macroglobulin family)